MENFFSRYKNPLVLMAVLFLQVIALATQVKRPESGRAAGGTRLIRVWTATAITPFERALVATGHFFRNTWHDYLDLHDVRKQNRQLQDELARMRMEQVRRQGDADQVRRLRALLDFKERYVGQTVAAQVIGTSGSDLVRTIQIDKGSSNAGLKPDMAVITPDGIVGKVKEVFPFSSQVLLINDRESGAGVILENSRLHGILRGSAQGFLQVNDVMADEKVDVGEQVITSGGDRVYPKGLPVGTVTHVASDSEGGPFLAVRIKPAAQLDRLEEVLIVTKIAEESPVAGDDTTPHRAADVLSQRLPSIQKPLDSATAIAPAAAANKTAGNAAANAAANATPGTKAGAKENATPGPPARASRDGVEAPGANRNVTPPNVAPGTAVTKKKIASEDTANAAPGTTVAKKKIAGDTAGAASPSVANGASAANASPSPNPAVAKKKIAGDAASTASPGPASAKKKVAPEDSGQNATPANATKAKPKVKATPTPAPTPSPSRSPDEGTPKAEDKPPAAAGAEKPPR